MNYEEKLKHYHSVANLEMGRLYGNKASVFYQQGSQHGPSYNVFEQAITFPKESQGDVEDRFFRNSDPNHLKRVFANDLEKIQKIDAVLKQFPNLSDMDLVKNERDFFIEFTMLHESVHFRDTGAKSYNESLNLLVRSNKEYFDANLSASTFGLFVSELKADAIAIRIMDGKHAKDEDYQSFREKLIASRVLSSLKSQTVGESHDFTPLIENNAAFLNKLPIPNQSNIMDIEQKIEQAALKYMQKQGISKDFESASEAIAYGKEKMLETCEDTKTITQEQCFNAFGIKSLNSELTEKDQSYLNTVKKEGELNFSILNKGTFEFGSGDKETPEINPEKAISKSFNP